MSPSELYTMYNATKTNAKENEFWSRLVETRNDTSSIFGVIQKLPDDNLLEMSGDKSTLTHLGQLYSRHVLKKDVPVEFYDITKRKKIGEARAIGFTGLCMLSGAAADFTEAGFKCLCDERPFLNPVDYICRNNKPTRVTNEAPVPRPQPSAR